MERFSLKKLNEVESKEKYRVEVSDRFAALEDLDAKVGINNSKVKLSHNRPLRIPYCLENQLTDGGKTVSLTRRLLLYDPETLFFCF
jgi:hypothetical protein